MDDSQIPNKNTEIIIQQVSNKSGERKERYIQQDVFPFRDGESITRHVDYLISRKIIERFEKHDSGNWFIRKGENFNVATTQFDSILDYENYLRSIESQEGGKKKLELELIKSNLRLNTDTLETNQQLRKASKTNTFISISILLFTGITTVTAIQECRRSEQSTQEKVPSSNREENVRQETEVYPQKQGNQKNQKNVP